MPTISNHSQGVAITPIAPLAMDATAITAPLSGSNSGSVYTINGNPDVPRSLSVTFEVLWDGGDIQVSGTDIFNRPISETITSNPGSTSYSTFIYKTVATASKTAVGVLAGTASVGTGDLICPFLNHDALLLLDATNLGFGLQLPSVNDVTISRKYTIQKQDSSGNTIGVIPADASTIDGETLIVIAAQFEDITIVNDGTNWVQI